MSKRSRVLYLMAVNLEYEGALKKKIIPAFTGVGPIEAAMYSTNLLLRRMFDGVLPDRIFLIGSAGSANREPKEVYQIRNVCYRDMDATALGFGQGVTPYSAAPPTLSLDIIDVPLPVANIATGATVVTSADEFTRVRNDFGCDLVDMESYSVARVCYDFGILNRLTILKGVTDGLDPITSEADWLKHMKTVGDNLSTAIDLVHGALGTYKDMLV